MVKREKCSLCGNDYILYDLHTRMGYGGKRVYTCIYCAEKGHRQVTDLAFTNRNGYRLKRYLYEERGR